MIAGHKCHHRDRLGVGLPRTRNASAAIVDPEDAIDRERRVVGGGRRAGFDSVSGVGRAQADVVEIEFGVVVELDGLVVAGDLKIAESDGGTGTAAIEKKNRRGVRARAFGDADDGFGRPRELEIVGVESGTTFESQAVAAGGIGEHRRSRGSLRLKDFVIAGRKMDRAAIRASGVDGALNRGGRIVRAGGIGAIRDDVVIRPRAFERGVAGDLKRRRADARGNERAGAECSGDAGVAADREIAAQADRSGRDGIERRSGRIVRKNRVVHRVGVDAGA